MTPEVEDLEHFRLRARQWLSDNLPRRRGDTRVSLERAHELQAILFDGGFAGIAFPREYGGGGLTLEHQRVFAEEAAGYETPSGAFLVSVGMLAPTLLDHASEDLKREHLPKILRGDETWIQLLSEPDGGSDMAGVVTTALRDGDTWILNGSKIWSSMAHISDFGLCLARTDWDVPKHRGLSMFALPLDATGVTVERIRGVDGELARFCQEFIDDVILPAGHLVGELNGGWNVAQSLLLHERNATAGVGHGIGLGPPPIDDTAERRGASGVDDLVRFAAAGALAGDPIARQLIGEAHVQHVVAEQANVRVIRGTRTGALQGPWGSLLKLGVGVNAVRRAELALSLEGAAGVIWAADDDPPGDAGHNWLTARALAIAGGTNEIQRNIVSERLLGLPREAAPDRDVPFREVRRLGRG